MRTTINLPDELIAQVKRVAVQSRTTLTAVIESSLRDTLARRRKPLPRAPFKVLTHGRGGTLPGVDLDDSARLLDVMEGGDGSSRR